MARRETTDPDPEYLVAPGLPWCTGPVPVAFGLLTMTAMVPVPPCRSCAGEPVTVGRTGVVTGMFGRLADSDDDPSVRGTQVLPATGSGDGQTGPE
jgi:hypothetical protein